MLLSAYDSKRKRGKGFSFRTFIGTGTWHTCLPLCLIPLTPSGYFHFPSPKISSSDPIGNGGLSTYPQPHSYLWTMSQALLHLWEEREGWHRGPPSSRVQALRTESLENRTLKFLLLLCSVLCGHIQILKPGSTAMRGLCNGLGNLLVRCQVH